MADAREQRIQSALSAIQGGQRVVQAARDWGLPPRTLYNRLRGATTRRDVKALEQKLSPAQEEILVDWILLEEACGRAPKGFQVRQFAGRILAEGGDDSGVNKKWLYRFLRRNEAIRGKIGNPLSSARAKYTTKGAVVNFFNLLERHLREKNILPENIANMDECGLQEGESSGGRVFGSALTRKVYI